MHKVPSGQLLAFMYICVILLEFGKDRPTRDQVFYLSGISALEGLQRRAAGKTSQFILQDTPPAGI